MNKIFNPSSDEVLVLAILYCVFGIVLIVFNVDILLTAIRVLGCVSMVVGLVMIYLFLAKKRNMTISSLFIGFPAAVIGLLVLVNPDSLLSFFPMVVAILLIIHALSQIEQTFRLKKHGYTQWKYSLTVAILILIAGIVILVNPIKTIAIILKIIGVGLIVEALLLFVHDNLFKKYIE